MFNSRIISLIIALIVATGVLVIQYFLGHLDTELLVVIFPAVVFVAFVCVYLSLEYLIFTEINKIYSVLDRIKKNDINIKEEEYMTPNMPVGKRKKIYEEINTYVTKKQDEVNELKKLEVFRREFLADISHELKTPIFAAQGFIHTLLDGAMSDKEVREKFLKKAAKSLDGLQEMVEELLTLTKLEIGELQMYIDDFDINLLTKDVFEMLEKKAEKKNIDLKFTEQSNLPIWVKGDSYQIKQVMKNLVENAINYGYEKGKVVISFDVEKENVVVSVKDDGPGIPPEHLKRIFERFYRIEKSRSKEKGGSGLGLAIVQEIIEAHHSKVMVSSIVGKGTSFAFILKKSVPDVHIGT